MKRLYQNENDLEIREGFAAGFLIYSKYHVKICR